MLENTKHCHNLESWCKGLAILLMGWPTAPVGHSSAVPLPQEPISAALVDTSSKEDAWTSPASFELPLNEKKLWAILFSVSNPQEGQLHWSHLHWLCKHHLPQATSLRPLCPADVSLSFLIFPQKGKMSLSNTKAVFFFSLFTNTFPADFEFACSSWI